LKTDRTVPLQEAVEENGRDRLWEGVLDEIELQARHETIGAEP
jgi:hypothetical protein